MIRNGSQSLHAVGDEGISVRGRGRAAWEQLNIRCAGHIDVRLPRTSRQLRMRTRRAEELVLVKRQVRVSQGLVQDLGVHQGRIYLSLTVSLHMTSPCA